MFSVVCKFEYIFLLSYSDIRPFIKQASSRLLASKIVGRVHRHTSINVSLVEGLTVKRRSRFLAPLYFLSPSVYKQTHVQLVDLLHTFHACVTTYLCVIFLKHLFRLIFLMENDDSYPLMCRL